MPDPIPFAAPADWNDWLARNPNATECWMLLHKKASGIPSVTWEQAVIEALAHGWIDSTKRPLNDTQWLQRFSHRKPGSAWSKKNVAHVEKLIADGRMTPAGLAHVMLAKQNGRWDAAYSASSKVDLPPDFLAAVDASPQATEGWQKLNRQNRFAIYYRLTTAKRPETRAKRFADYLQLLEQGKSLF